MGYRTKSLHKIFAEVVHIDFLFMQEDMMDYYSSFSKLLKNFSLVLQEISSHCG